MNQELVDTYGPLANDIGERTGLHPSVVLGIIDTETGGGKRMHANNLFGISPVVNGRQVVAGYPDVGAAATAFVDLMSSKRYAGIGKLTDPAEQAKALVAAGYNTADKSYAQKVADRAGQAIKLGVAPPVKAAAAGDGKSERERAVEEIGGDEQRPAAPVVSGESKPAGAKSERDLAVEEVQAGIPPTPAKPPFKYGVQGGAEEFGIPGAAPAPGAAGPPMPPPAAKGPLDYAGDVYTRMNQAREEGFATGILGPDAEAWLRRQGRLGTVANYLQRDIGAGVAMAGQGYNELVQRPVEAVAGRGAVAPLDTALMMAGMLPFMRGGAPRQPGGLTRTVEDIRDAPATIRQGFVDRQLQKEAPLSTEFRRDPIAPEAPGRFRTEQEQRIAEGQPPAGPAETVPGAQRSAGAAGTPFAQIRPKTLTERASDLKTAIDQTAEDRAGPGMRDDTAYVEGIPTRLLAERRFDPTTARDEKFAREKHDPFSKEAQRIERERHQGMKDIVSNEAGNANTLKQLAEERHAAAPPEHTFVGEKPTNQGQRVVDMIDRMLEGREGQRDKVRPILEKIRARFFDADGNLEVLPSRLRGARENMQDYLRIAFGAGDEAKAAQLVTDIISKRLMPVTDEAITSGAPRYADWLKTWHQKSLPIDRQKFFQQYTDGPKKLWDADGHLQPNKVQKMLEDIHDGLTSAGANNAKSLTDAQIEKMIAIRNEVATTRLKRRMEDLTNSSTFMMIDRAAAQGERIFGQLGNALTQGVTFLGTGDPQMNAALMGVQTALHPFVKERKAAQRLRAAEAKKEERRQNLLTQGPAYGTELY